MTDRIFSHSSFSHIVDVPIERVDISDWLFNLPEAEYQRCCPPDHIAAGATSTDNGRRMSAFAAVAIDVENMTTIASESSTSIQVSAWIGPMSVRSDSCKNILTRSGTSSAKPMRMTLTAPNRRDRNFTSSKMSLLKVTRKATTLLTLPDVGRRKESQTFSLIPCCSRRRTNFGSNRRFAERNR